MAKVVHIITGLNQGGAETVLTRLLENSTFYDDFYIVSLTGRGYYSDYIKYPIYHLNYSNPFALISSSIKLIRILRKIQPDIIQTWLYHSDLIGGVIGKIFTDASIFWNIRNGNLDPKLISRSTWIAAKSCALFSRIIPDKIISCSAKAAATHESLGYFGNKFIIIPNGIRFPNSVKSIKNRNVFLEKFSLPQDAILIGNISRWNPLKDHKTLLESFSLVLSKNPNIYLLLVGNGLEEDNSELGILIDHFNLRKRVILFGQLKDISYILRVLDLFVLSSVGEAFPNVLIEAMSHEIYCVSTDVGDAAYILGDDKFIVQPQSSVEMAETINYCLYLISSGTKLNKFYTDRIKNLFSVENMCLQYHLAWKKAKK